MFDFVLEINYDDDDIIHSFEKSSIAGNITNLLSNSLNLAV